MEINDDFVHRLSLYTYLHRGVTCLKNKNIENYINISKSNLSINLQFSWPWGPMLWETVSYIYSFVHAKYDPDRPSI